MALDLSLMNELLNVNGFQVVNYKLSTDKGNKVIYLDVELENPKQCPHCQRTCPGYDHHYRSAALWRAADMCQHQVFIRYTPWRVHCPEHGVVTESLPWVPHKSRFTWDFEQTVAWLVRHMPVDYVSKYMRIDWDTALRIFMRVMNTLEPDKSKRYADLQDIGVDETSYKKGHKYITTVVNHATNTVIWAHEGHGYNVFRKFFEELTPEQRASIQSVSGDGAKWIDKCVQEFVPHAKRCADPFHVVEWSMAALDRIRLEASRAMRKSGRSSEAKDIKHSSYALGKSPENLTDKQKERLKFIQETCPDLYAAYRLKEELRKIVTLSEPELARQMLEQWCSTASNFDSKYMKELSEKILRHKESIINTVEIGVNNGRIEANNNKIKTIIRRSYGFRSVDNLLNMVQFCCSKLKIELPRQSVWAQAA